jgi:hypothetical protein
MRASLSEALARPSVDWLARAGLTVTTSGTVVQLLEFGVQPRFSFDAAQVPLVVRRASERRAEAQTVLEGSRLIDVERWAILLVAPDVRRRAGLDERGGPPDDRPAEGFEIEVRDRDLVVVDPTGVERLRFVGDATLPWEAHRFTHAADMALEEIIGRLESDAGW